MKSRARQKASKFIRRFLASGLFCLLLFQNAFARTLSEYHADLMSAQSYTRQLIDYIDRGEAPNVAFERETLAAFRKVLPGTEKIEWDGNSLETGNQWLESKLKAFEEETKDRSKRRLILTEIRERLAAIEAKIIELDRAASSDRSKDEEKRKLAEILRRPEYQKPAEQQESWFERTEKKIRDWFNEKFPQPNLPAGSGQGFQTVSFGLQLVLYAAVLGFIAFLLYRFAPFFADRFGRRQRSERGERVILGEKLAADEDSATLFDEAEALARAGDLRAAIRKGYVALLCELSDRKIIGLAQHKTNRDYLRDVRQKDALYRNMSGLTASFERHWYGFETADETDWQEFKENYRRALGGES